MNTTQMQELIKEAIEQSEDFKQRMTYWVHIRQRQPDQKWVLDKLAEVLGKERIINYLKELQNKE